MRYKFVKHDPIGNAVVVTSYDASADSADEVLDGLRKFDYEAVKRGWSWEKIPVDKTVETKRPTPSKEWTGPLMNGEPMPVGGVPSDETYLRKMRERGIDAEEAARLKKLLDGL